MAVKFKNSININDQYTLPSTVGLTNQYLKVNDAATGELIFADLGTAAQVSTIAYEVRNETGASIPKGSVVYISGGSGSSDHVLISLSTATSEAGSSKTFGITAETIANNSTGDVVLEGIIEGIDTSAFTSGGTLWLGDTPGSIQTAPPPSTPSHAVFVGYAVRIQQNNGSMFVKIQNGYELEELHDVLVTSATDGQVLTWDAANSYWKNVDQLQPGQSVIYTDNFTGDNSTTIFTLSNDIDSENNTSVYFDGVYQSKSNYSLSGNQLTFTAAPPNTVNIEVVSIENITLSSPAEGDYAAFYPLISDLDAEETARIAADNTLQTNINTEASARASADTTLQGNINTEEAARIAADSNLQTQINTKIDGSGTANYIPKWTDGDTIGNSVIYDDGTNVGIGTSNPSEALEVAGTILIDTISSLTNAGLEISTANNRSGRILFNDSDASSQGRLVYDHSTDSMEFFTLSTERMRIDSAGNVGIGTSSPTTKLHLSDSSDVVLRLQRVGVRELQISSAVGVAALSENLTLSSNIGNVLFSTNATERMRITSGGNVGIGTTIPTSGLQILGSDIRVTGSGNVASYGYIKGIENTVNTHKMTLGTTYGYNTNVDALTIFNGNVGIGTTNPVRDFHLHRDALPDIHITNSASGTTATDGATLTLADLDFIINNREAGNLRLSTSGAERMRIDSSGRVGIGTTLPDSKLHIENGDLTIKSLNQSTYIRFTENAGQYLGAYINYNGDSNQFYFGTHNAADANLVNDVRAFVINRGSTDVTFFGAVTATALTETSALRFKENIQEDIDASIIDKLRPVSYDWKEDKKKDYGFIAEEVNELDSTLTTQDEEGEMIGIKYTKLIPFLVKKIQEQEERIKQLENGKS